MDVLEKWTTMAGPAKSLAQVTKDNPILFPPQGTVRHTITGEDRKQPPRPEGKDYFFVKDGKWVKDLRRGAGLGQVTSQDNPKINVQAGPLTMEIPLTRDQTLVAANAGLRILEVSAKQQNAEKWRSWGTFGLTGIASAILLIGIARGVTNHPYNQP